MKVYHVEVYSNGWNYNSSVAGDIDYATRDGNYAIEKFGNDEWEMNISMVNVL